MYDFKKIRELAREGCGASQIALKLEINRKTASKYLASNNPPSYPKNRKGRTREDRFNPFEERVLELMKNEELSAVEIYELIKEEGYQGGERTARRRIAEIRAKKSKERFFEQEYEPGEQSQFDFKESVELPFQDGMRVVHLVFGTLPCSGRYFIKATPRKNFECFIEGIHSFFEFIGGITKNIRIDNLSPCVTKVYQGSRRQYTDSFQKAIDHYGFGVLPCSPGKGNEKGDVERDIRTHSRRIKNLVSNQGKVFLNFDDLNEWLKLYVERRTTDKINTAFEDESKHLLPLPSRKEEVLCRIEEHTATAFGIIRIGDYHYSVPDSLIREKCISVSSAFDIKIYRKSPRELVVTHLRTDGDKILIEHVIPSLVRKPLAMIRWAHRDILFENEVYKKFYSVLRSSNEEEAEKQFLKSVNLIQYVPLTEITAGMEILLNEGGKGNLYEELKNLLLGERRPGNVVDVSLSFGQEKLNPSLKDFDELIPKGG